MTYKNKYSISPGDATKAQYYQAIFESIDEAAFILQLLYDDNEEPVDFVFLDANANFLNIPGMVESIGKTVRSIAPYIESYWITLFAKIAHSGTPIRTEEIFPHNQKWYDIYAFKVDPERTDRVAVIFRDITARKTLHNNLQFIRDLDEELVHLTSPQSMMLTAAEKIMAHLNASRLTFAVVDDDLESVTTLFAKRNDEVDWNPSHFKLSDYFADDTLESLLRGKTLAVDDVSKIPINDAKTKAYKKYNVRAYILAPHLSNGRLKFFLNAHIGQPRQWQAHEIALMTELSTRLWLRFERALIEKQLREKDQLKDRFLSVLSHELRNPLSPLKNNLYFLKHGDATEDDKQNAIETIERQVNQLHRLVDDLLDITRLSHNKVPLKRQRLNLVTIVNNAVDDYRYAFKKQNISLAISMPETPLFIHGDAQRLSQLFGNIILNAAKFNPAGSHVEIQLLSDSDTQNAIIRVIDNGIGIEYDILSNIFEPFVQAETSLEHPEGGLGLGLPLVKEIAELHGGTVHIYSAGLGHGTEVEVRIPLDEQRSEQISSRQPQRQETGRKVLLIEDNLDVADSLKRVLMLGKHHVEVAADGPRGIELARTYQPDVIFCDIGLPGMDGYSVARALANDPDLDSIHLIALSGYAMPDDIQRARDAGFDEHIAKPPDIQVLWDAVNNAPVR